jgi:hypothetical protein
MKQTTLKGEATFRVVQGNHRSQAAEMVLGPGKKREAQTTVTGAATSGSLCSVGHWRCYRKWQAISPQSRDVDSN